MELSIHQTYRTVMHQIARVSHDSTCTCQCNMASCSTDRPVHLSEAMRPEPFEHKALEQLRSHTLATGQAPCPQLGCSGRIYRYACMQRCPAGCPMADASLLSSSTSWSFSPARHRQGTAAGCPDAAGAGSAPSPCRVRCTTTHPATSFNAPPSLVGGARVSKKVGKNSQIAHSVEDHDRS